jgi:hypothetical protein
MDLFLQGDVNSDSGCYTESWSWSEAVTYRRKEVAVHALITDFWKAWFSLALHVSAQIFHHQAITLCFLGILSVLLLHT